MYQSYNHITIEVHLFFLTLIIAVVCGTVQIWKSFLNLKQTWAARMIYDLPTCTLTAPLLSKLNWMTIIDRVKYRMAIMVYKSLNGLAPPYMRKMFKFVSHVRKGIQDMLTKPNSIYLQVNISNVLQIVLPTQQQKCGILFPNIFVTVRP